jgi:hypothetical protein
VLVRSVKNGSIRHRRSYSPTPRAADRDTSSVIRTVCTATGWPDAGRALDVAAEGRQHS